MKEEEVMRSVLRCTWMAATLSLLVMPSAHAQSSRNVGNVLCKDFLRAARTSDILYHQAANWILGYVSGMNAALLATKGTSAAAGLSNDQLLKSAGDYCEANPGSTISAAAHQWHGALPQQAEAPQPPESKRGNFILNLDRAPERKFNR
jgi:hypothetical protein